MAEPAYIIGIDLGTSNSILAYTETAQVKGTAPDIRVFPVPQLVSTGAVASRDLLPSFVYLPPAHEKNGTGLSLPWQADGDTVVGAHARDRGADVPDRLIASAKSWLCNARVDRNAAILPWQAAEGTARMSPVAASATILKHLKDAWNQEMAADDDYLRMEHQDIYLTVPASFDAVARELTIQAAAQAGLLSVTLLEEPQAAFYAWIDASGDAWRDAVSVGDRVLVCDVGGGTTDFSLISVTEADGELVLERKAVGDHLLVGGDNMDLALAYALSAQLAAKGTRLDPFQMRGLTQRCRQIKEDCLAGGDTRKDAYTVSILGRGSRLIGSTIRADLPASLIDQVVVSGFFPDCGLDEGPKAPVRTGLKELGLAYEADPAITRHLAQFLTRGHWGEGSVIPDAVLFNGGIMKAGQVRERLLSVMNAWQPGTAVREIPHTDYDVSVARGAVYYGAALHGDGVRIRGGLGRAYYIGIETSMPAVPGLPTPMKSLCVAPFGMEAGTRCSAGDTEFGLVVGEPVKFDFLGSTTRFEDQPGMLLDEWEQGIEPITLLETRLDGEDGAVIPVNLEMVVTEIGTLEVWCVARDGGQRWRLEFNVREQQDDLP